MPIPAPRWRSFGVAAVLLFLVPASLVAGAGQARAAGSAGPRVFMGLSSFDLKLDIDTVLDIQGPTRFFSSRHTQYVGGRFAFHSERPANKKSWTGSFFGFAWGKNSFLMNWEEPGLQSFPPLKSSISTLSMPFGYDLNFALGEVVELAPFVVVKYLLHRMVLTVDGEDFDGTAHKFSGGFGGKVTLDLGKLRLAGGASIDHIFGEDVDFEVDDLTFAGRNTESSVEYFLGVISP